MDNNNQNNDGDQYTNYTYTPDTSSNNTTYSNPGQPVNNNPYSTPQPNNNNSFNYNYNYDSNDNGEEQGKGKSIASMVTGICSIVTCACYGIPGIILGIIALVLSSSYKRMNNGNKNGFSQAGFICGLIGLILSSLFLIYIIVLIAIGAGIALYDL